MPCTHEDLTEPQTNISTPINSQTWAHASNSKAGEVETDRSLGLSSRPFLYSILQAHVPVDSKKKEDTQLRRKNTQGWPLTSTCMHTHACAPNTYMYLYTHATHL